MTAAQVVAFFDAIDRSLEPDANGETLVLYHIGRSALVWEYGVDATTEDVDVVRVGRNGRLENLALERFGRGTPQAAVLGAYLDGVPNGLPPMPGGYDRRATRVARDWRAIRVFHLDPNDFVVTKLKRFAAKDRQDVRMLCDRNLIDPDRLEASFNSAWWMYDKPATPECEQARINLRNVRRYLDGDPDAL